MACTLRRRLRKCEHLPQRNRAYAGMQGLGDWRFLPGGPLIGSESAVAREICHRACSTRRLIRPGSKIRLANINRFLITLGSTSSCFRHRQPLTWNQPGEPNLHLIFSSQCQLTVFGAKPLSRVTAPHLARSSWPQLTTCFRRRRPRRTRLPLYHRLRCLSTARYQNAYRTLRASRRTSRTSCDTMAS